MGILQWLGIRRRIPWEKPTLLDEFLDSPLQALTLRLYLIILWLRGRAVRPPKNRPAIKIVCISDTHDEIVPKVPDGDLLIHAGDLTQRGTAVDIQKQIDWLDSLPHQHKVLVSGNHDSYFDLNSRREEDTLGHQTVDLKGVQYLQREMIELKFRGGRKLNVYGAPDIPLCGGSDFAFQYESSEHPWKGRVPIETDVLVTHGPPRHHLDLNLGCSSLLEELWRVKPRVHVFGHVHNGRGIQSVFWDECQKSYEKLMSRRKRGPFFDFMIPNYGWIDAIRVLILGYLSVVWHWLMQGGTAVDGTLLVNAGCQEGTSGKLTTKQPITIEI